MPASLTRCSRPPSGRLIHWRTRSATVWSRRRGWVRLMSATEDLYRSYLDLRWHFDPAAASATGVTTLDNRLGSFDAESMRTHLSAFKAMATAVEQLEIDETEEEIDRTAFLDEIRIT